MIATGAVTAPGAGTAPAAPYLARWDLDKTYLRTDFDTLRDLVRTALERPDQKRTVPGAAALMRALSDARIEIHILSGSPEQLRGRLVEKLRLDGVPFASFTLKPNLQNIMRLRFKAIRGQLGYKLPALLRRRCEMPAQRDAEGTLIAECLLGDDAEADAFVYSLYGDICRGVVDDDTLTDVLRAGDCYEDDIRDCRRYASYIEPGPVVERILIHLERQSSPAAFERFGARVVPFYNYLQAAFVLVEDGRLPPEAALDVARDMAMRHHFDGDSLARSYLELMRRGHVDGRSLEPIAAAYDAMVARGAGAGASELGAMVTTLLEHGEDVPPPRSQPMPELDYRALVRHHNPRRKR